MALSGQRSAFRSEENVSSRWELSGLPSWALGGTWSAAAPGAAGLTSHDPADGHSNAADPRGRSASSGHARHRLALRRQPHPRPSRH